MHVARLVDKVDECTLILVHMVDTSTMSIDIQSQKLEMADKEEPPVYEQLDELPPDSINRMDEFIEKAKQKLQTVKDTYEASKKQVIIELAEDISGLPGIIKTRVASFIAYGFKEHNVGVGKGYVYRVLKDKGYVDPAVSDAARRTQKEKYNAGWDPKSKTHINAQNYDIKNLPLYGEAALRNIVRGLSRKLEEKKTASEQEKDDGSAFHLRVENETLKQENAGLKRAKCWS